MSGSTRTFPPIEVQLDSFGLDGENNIWVRLRFDDGSEWDIEWAPESADAREVLEFLADLTSRTVARFAHRGFKVVGLTPLEQDEE